MVYEQVAMAPTMAPASRGAGLDPRTGFLKLGAGAAISAGLEGMGAAAPPAFRRAGFGRPMGTLLDDGCFHCPTASLTSAGGASVYAGIIPTARAFFLRNKICLSKKRFAGDMI